MQGLIYKGEVVPVTVPIQVRDGRKLGLWFHVGDSGTRDRDPYDIRLNVWHHQGGEGGARTLYRVLQKRGLSVHGQIDGRAVITQMADLDTVCSHAGAVNDISIGWEISNLGLAKPLRRIRNYIRRAWGYDRAIYTDEMHGKMLRYFRFYSWQVLAADLLCDAIAEIGIVPRKFLIESGRVSRKRDKRVTSFRGNIAHYHVTRNKVGAVPHLLDDLAFRATMPSPKDNTPTIRNKRS